MMGKGGAQPGSGRPKNPNKGVERSIVLPREMWDLIDHFVIELNSPSRSELFRSLVRVFISRKIVSNQVRKDLSSSTEEKESLHNWIKNRYGKKRNAGTK